MPLGIPELKTPSYATPPMLPIRATGIAGSDTCDAKMQPVGNPIVFLVHMITLSWNRVRCNV